MADAVAVLREVAEPNARLMIDLHHFHRSHESLESLSEIPTEWFEFVQICDAPGEIPDDLTEMARIIREGRCYLGEGGTDPGPVLAALPPTVYSVEIPSAADVARLGAEGHARRCLETSRTYLAGHGPTEKDAAHG